MMTRDVADKAHSSVLCQIHSTHSSTCHSIPPSLRPVPPSARFLPPSITGLLTKMASATGTTARKHKQVKRTPERTRRGWGGGKRLRSFLSFLLRLSPVEVVEALKEPLQEQMPGVRLQPGDRESIQPSLRRRCAIKVHPQNVIRQPEPRNQPPFSCACIFCPQIM